MHKSSNVGEVQRKRLGRTLSISQMKISAVAFCAVFCLFFASTQSKNSKDKDEKPKRDNGWALGHWKQFFLQYGYTSDTKPSPDEIRTAVTKLKILFQFDSTATDEDIIKFMGQPRCGNKDLGKKKVTFPKRVRRYDLNPAWRIKSFTYAFDEYSPDLTVPRQHEIAAQAFQLWKNAVPELNFTPIQNKDQADIKISFEKGAHTGCAQAFDGTGSIIAHAYYPEDGRIHLDDDEVFTDQSSQGTNLYSVLVHEIGHVLGLGHSFVSGAIMNPVYQQYAGVLTLHEDDINGMRMLYAPGTAAVPTCVDQDPGLCAMYLAEGYCIPEYADVMIETCPYSCNLCQ